MQRELAPLGPFVPIEMLGEGGSGIVYRAQWGHRQVALKILRDDVDVTERERRRFLDEAGRLSQMTHPGIVKIFSCGQLPDGRPYLAMELLEGQTLGQRLESGPLPADIALRVFADLARAVQAMHAHGLIHRDLKPENIYIVGGDQVVLLDFGIAKDLHGRDSTVTQEGGVRGTPAYMAPERFFGEPAGIATDVYELAVVLYCMLSGRLPWADGRDPLARLDPMPLSVHGLAAPGGLEGALRRALSTRADQRPRSVAELADAVLARPGLGSASMTRDLGPRRQTLDLLRDRGPLAEEPVAAPAPVVVRPRRSRALWAVGGLAASVVALALWIALARSGSESPSGAASSVATPVEAPAVTPALSPPPAEIPTRWGDDEGLRVLARHLPADTALVIALRFRELRQHPQLGASFSRLKSHPRWALVAELQTSCGIDLMDDVDWAAIGSHNQEDFELVAAGAWSRERAETCLVRWAGLEDSAVQRSGAISRFQGGRQGDFVLIWLDDRTFFLSTRVGLDERWLQARALGREGLEAGPLGPLASAIDPMSTAWILASGSSLLGQLELDRWLPEDTALDGVAAQLAMSDSLAARAILRAPGADAAQALEAAVRRRLDDAQADPFAKLLLSDLQLGAKGPDVTLSLSLGPSLTQVVATALESTLKDIAAQ